MMNLRKNIRLKEYNYSLKGLYFITICVKNRNYIFGKLSDYKMILNEKGILVKDVLSKTNNDKYEIVFNQIMPNHLHFIVKIKQNNIIKLSSIISVIKSKCCYKVGIKELWQRGYYERVIRDQKEFDNIVKYIFENPYCDKYNW